MRRRWLAVAALMTCGVQVWASGKKTLRVAAKGGSYTTIQAAVAAAPESGAVIRIAPGPSREGVHVHKAGIEFRGVGYEPAKVELVYGTRAASTCGTR
jgi:pectinesterase